MGLDCYQGLPLLVFSAIPQGPFVQAPRFAPPDRRNQLVAHRVEHPLPVVAFMLGYFREVGPRLGVPAQYVKLDASRTNWMPRATFNRLGWARITRCWFRTKD